MNTPTQTTSVPRETVVFIHIPKTAGSSVRSLLAQNYDLNKMFTFSGLPDGREWFWTRDQAFHDQFDLIHGHEPFGVHKCISHPCRYFTFLREPIARYFSDFFFAKEYPPHRLYQRISSGEMSALDYANLCNERVYFDNMLTQHISGNYLQPVTAETLAQAKDNLENSIEDFGLSECFEESVLRFARRFQWRFPFFISKNISPEKLDNIPQDAIEKVKEKLVFDQALYDFAQDLLAKRSASNPASFAPAFEQYKAVLTTLHEGYNRQRHRLYVVNDGVDPELESINKSWETGSQRLGDVDVSALRAYLNGE